MPTTPLPLPLPDAAEGGWRAEAACREDDVDLFFATDEASQAEALARCGACPVATACLEHAIVAREPYGIWGGTTEQERKRLARRRREGRAA